MTLPTLYPPLGSLALPKGSALPAPGVVVITQEAHGTNEAQDLDTKPDDATIYAAHDGILDYQPQAACGNSVHVTNARLRSGYCHLSSWERNLVGKPVKAGQVIGRMGDSGSMPDGSPTRPHLHFFVRVDGLHVYPGDFPYSVGGAMATAIVFGKEKPEKPWVIDVPEGTILYSDSDGTRLIAERVGGATRTYYGNPHGATDYGIVAVKTARLTGVLEWIGALVKDVDVPAPRFVPQPTDPSLALRAAIETAKPHVNAAKAALESV